jgi:hypothetical protein
MSGKLIGPLREQLAVHALTSVYWPRPARRVLEGHRELYAFAADAIGRETPVLYLEFGVAQGSSMRQMLEFYTNRDSRFVGFDSFLGLPEAWLMHPPGAYSNGGIPPKISDPRASFGAGWFQNTVPAYLRGLPSGHSRQILIHFDADLYSSTLFLLASTWFAFDQFWFIFDDFIYDDAVALFDFSEAFPVDIEFLAQTKGGGSGPNPDQVFGQLSRTEFSIKAPDASAAVP